MALATDLICDGCKVFTGGRISDDAGFQPFGFASLSLLFDVHARGGAFVRGAAGKNRGVPGGTPNLPLALGLLTVNRSFDAASASPANF
jgi:hypothetical protein